MRINNIFFHLCDQSLRPTIREILTYFFICVIDKSDIFFHMCNELIRVTILQELLTYFFICK
jgi:hypothetical protein